MEFGRAAMRLDSSTSVGVDCGRELPYSLKYMSIVTRVGQNKSDVVRTSKMQFHRHR